MKTKTKSGRQSFNRAVRLLSQLYDIKESVVNYYYNVYHGNISVVKMHLSRINKAGYELEIINDINLSF